MSQSTLEDQITPQLDRAISSDSVQLKRSQSNSTKVSYAKTNEMFEQQPSAAISIGDAQRYEDLGLGRGVDVTDPQMWRNKGSFLVRKVCRELSNIIGTEDGGLKEKYEKEVSTVAMHQQKIRLSLDDPNSLVKISMDAQSSQSTSSAKKIAGTKVRTRTIAFQTDFDDIPHQCPTGRPRIQTSYQHRTHEDNHFEDQLYNYLLNRIHDREKQPRKSVSLLSPSYQDHKPESESVPAVKLTAKLKDICKSKDPSKVEAIVTDCNDFVTTLGITHYISAIKLGAVQYRVFSASIKQTKVGAGAEIAGGHLVKGSLSGVTSRHWFHKCEEEQEIGRISKDGRVRRGTSDEAVIGCQIQPVYKLVRIQFIQMALQESIKEYIQAKEDKSEGPFHISCEINKTSVYWTVNDERRHGHVIGTTARKDASPFYLIPTENKFHPAEFFIAYYGAEKEANKKLPFCQRLTKQNLKKLPLPLYLSTKSNLFGTCDGPLSLETTVEIQQARFCLHSRIQNSFTCMMCTSTPVSWKTWPEGEQFYINCSRRSCKVDGYIAMKQESDTTYKTITVPRIKESTGLGMLFRLCSPEKQPSTPATTPVSRTPLISQSSRRALCNTVDSPLLPAFNVTTVHATVEPKASQSEREDSPCLSEISREDVFDPENNTQTVTTEVSHKATKTKPPKLSLNKEYMTRQVSIPSGHLWMSQTPLSDIDTPVLPPSMNDRLEQENVSIQQVEGQHSNITHSESLPASLSGGVPLTKEEPIEEKRTSQSRAEIILPSENHENRGQPEMKCSSTSMFKPPIEMPNSARGIHQQPTAVAPVSNQPIITFQGEEEVAQLPMDDAPLHAKVDTPHKTAAKRLLQMTGMPNDPVNETFVTKYAVTKPQGTTETKVSPNSSNQVDADADTRKRASPKKKRRVVTGKPPKPPHTQRLPVSGSTKSERHTKKSSAPDTQPQVFSSDSLKRSAHSTNSESTSDEDTMSILIDLGTQETVFEGECTGDLIQRSEQSDVEGRHETQSIPGTHVHIEGNTNIQLSSESGDSSKAPTSRYPVLFKSPARTPSKPGFEDCQSNQPQYTLSSKTDTDSQSLVTNINSEADSNNRHFDSLKEERESSASPIMSSHLSSSNHPQTEKPLPSTETLKTAGTETSTDSEGYQTPLSPSALTESDASDDSNILSPYQSDEEEEVRPTFTELQMVDFQGTQQAPSSEKAPTKETREQQFSPKYANEAHVPIELSSSKTSYETPLSLRTPIERKAMVTTSPSISFANKLTVIPKSPSPSEDNAFSDNEVSSIKQAIEKSPNTPQPRFKVSTSEYEDASDEKHSNEEVATKAAPILLQEQGLDPPCQHDKDMTKLTTQTEEVEEHETHTNQLPSLELTAGLNDEGSYENYVPPTEQTTARKVRKMYRLQYSTSSLSDIEHTSSELGEQDNELFPQRTLCCGTHIKHAKELIRNQLPCPLCNKDYLETELDTNFDGVCLAEVSCPKRGCMWKGGLLELNKHVSMCAFKEEPSTDHKRLSRKIFSLEARADSKTVGLDNIAADEVTLSSSPSALSTPTKETEETAAAQAVMNTSSGPCSSPPVDADYGSQPVETVSQSPSMKTVPVEAVARLEFNNQQVLVEMASGQCPIKESEETADSTDHRLAVLHNLPGSHSPSSYSQPVLAMTRLELMNNQQVPFGMGSGQYCYRTVCCRQHITHNIATKLIEEKKPCPFCKDDCLETEIDPHSTPLVGHAVVRCPNKGCDWTGELAALDEHAKSCGFQEEKLSREYPDQTERTHSHDVITGSPVETISMEPITRNQQLPLGMGSEQYRHRTLCCGQRIAHEVATKHIEEKKPCPFCKDDCLETEIDPHAVPLVGHAVVRCPNKGCDWTGELAALDEHAESCASTEEVLSKEYQDHTERGPFSQATTEEVERFESNNDAYQVLPLHLPSVDIRDGKKDALSPTISVGTEPEIDEAERSLEFSVDLEDSEHIVSDIEGLDAELYSHQTLCCGKHISQEDAIKLLKEQGSCPLCNEDYLETKIVHTDNYDCSYKGEDADQDKHVWLCAVVQNDEQLQETKMLSQFVLFSAVRTYDTGTKVFSGCTGFELQGTVKPIGTAIDRNEHSTRMIPIFLSNCAINQILRAMSQELETEMKEFERGETVDILALFQERSRALSISFESDGTSVGMGIEIDHRKLPGYQDEYLQYEDPEIMEGLLSSSEYKAYEEDTSNTVRRVAETELEPIEQRSTEQDSDSATEGGSELEPPTNQQDSATEEDSESEPLKQESVEQDSSDHDTARDSKIDQQESNSATEEDCDRDMAEDSAEIEPEHQFPEQESDSDAVVSDPTDSEQQFAEQDYDSVSEPEQPLTAQDSDSATKRYNMPEPIASEEDSEQEHPCTEHQSAVQDSDSGTEGGCYEPESTAQNSCSDTEGCESTERHPDIQDSDSAAEGCGSRLEFTDPWSMQKSTLLKIEDLAKAYRDTFEVQGKWRKMLLNLGLEDTAIEFIGAKCRDDPADCYREGLYQWLRTGERTWGDLIEALTSLSRPESTQGHLPSQDSDSGTEGDNEAEPTNTDLQSTAVHLKSKDAFHNRGNLGNEFQRLETNTKLRKGLLQGLKNWQGIRRNLMEAFPTPGKLEPVEQFTDQNSDSATQSRDQPVHTKENSSAESNDETYTDRRAETHRPQQTKYIKVLSDSEGTDFEGSLAEIQLTGDERDFW